MGLDIVFKQKKLRNIREFVFLNDHLSYKIKDATGERTCNIAYEAIDVPHKSEYISKNKNFAENILKICLCWFFAAMLVGKLINSTAGVIAFVAASSAILFVSVAYLAGWLSIAFTIFPIGNVVPGFPKTISVIRDKQSARLIEELTGRWRARIRSLYGTANLNADPAEKARRLDYLRKLEIISDDECKAQIKRLDHGETPMQQRYIN